MNSPPLTMQARDPSYLPRGAAHGRPPRTSAFEPILPSDDLKRCPAAARQATTRAAPTGCRRGAKRHHVGATGSAGTASALSELAGRAPRQLLRRRDPWRAAGYWSNPRGRGGAEVHISGSWLPWSLARAGDSMPILGRTDAAIALLRVSELALGKALDHAARGRGRAGANAVRTKVVETHHVLTPPPRRPTREAGSPTAAPQDGGGPSQARAPSTARKLGASRTLLRRGLARLRRCPPTERTPMANLSCPRGA